MVLEWFAELLMNTTRDTVEPAMRAAADDICGDFPDIVPTDTRNLMGFFANLRRLMLEVCGQHIIDKKYMLMLALHSVALTTSPSLISQNLPTTV
jgi:hypothetical protein